MSLPSPAKPLGLVLAGGRASRMGGGDKPLRPLGRGTLLSSLLARLAPQCASLAISARSDAAWAVYGQPVLLDAIDDAGPMAGVLAGLVAVASHDATGWLLTVPGDTPFIPPDLVSRLTEGCRSAGTDIACAASAGRSHHAVALWSATLVGPVRDAMQRDDTRSLRRLQAMIGCTAVEWPTTPYDPFFNVNTPDDLIAAERMAEIAAND